MTPNQLAIGHPATTRRPLQGRRSVSSVFVSRLLGCVLLGAIALPVFAQPGAPVVEAFAANLTAASANPASIQPASIQNSLATQTFGAAMPPQEHAIHFAGAGEGSRLLDAAATTVQSSAQSGTQSESGSRIQNLLQHALALLGTPYRWGGTGTDGFDCSGLVGYVFRSALGIELPRVSREMATSGQLVSDRASLSPGDLVFFGHRGHVSHVGIYVGEGRFLHAPRTGRDVTVSSLDSGYWGDKFMEARRVAGI